MKTLVVRIDDALDAKLERWASVRAKTKSALVRETLQNALSTSVEGQDSAYDKMLGGLGVVRSGIHDLASNPEHLKGFGKK
jgi:predicted transcriptional regulator